MNASIFCTFQLLDLFREKSLQKELENTTEFLKVLAPLHLSLEAAAAELKYLFGASTQKRDFKSRASLGDAFHAYSTVCSTSVGMRQLWSLLGHTLVMR